MKKIWLAVILAAILTAVPAHASLREALEKLRAENQHRQSLVVSEHTEELKERDEYPYQEQDAGTFDETVQEDGQIDDTLEQRQANAAPENAVLQEMFDKVWRDTEGLGTLRHRMMQPDFYDVAKDERRNNEVDIMGIVKSIVAIALSAAYLFWIRRILKSKTAKSVPGEIFRDAATVAGLLCALALASVIICDGSYCTKHLRSAMFIAVSSAVLPYLCISPTVTAAPIRGGRKYSTPSPPPYWPTGSCCMRQILPTEKVVATSWHHCSACSSQPHSASP